MVLKSCLLTRRAGFFCKKKKNEKRITFFVYFGGALKYFDISDCNLENLGQMDTLGRQHMYRCICVVRLSLCCQLALDYKKIDEMVNCSAVYDLQSTHTPLFDLVRGHSAHKEQAASFNSAL